MGLGMECEWSRGKHVREAGSETGLVSWGQATGEPQTSGEDFGFHLHSREDRHGEDSWGVPLGSPDLNNGSGHPHRVYY